MDEDCKSQYSQFLLESRVNSRLIEFRDSKDSRLVMVSIVDVLEQGLSAVYTFYDPDMTAGLGTFSILWQIEQCKKLGLPWLYLGYWIKDSPKMSYKSRFQPAQYLYHSKWHDVPPDSSFFYPA